MKAVCIARFPSDLNLSVLNNNLTKHSIPHRFTEEQQEQLLWLADISFERHARTIVGDFVSTVSDEPASEKEQVWVSAPFIKGAVSFIRMAPVTIVLILLGLLGFLVVELPWVWAYQMLTFTPIKVIGSQTFSAPWQWAELWRSFSPVFLHFGVGHIIFNAMAMLQMGSWVERLWGARWYALVCLSAGLTGNILQYLWEHSPMFGGLSGIVYGVFTFNYLTQRVNPAKAFPLPRGMYIWLAVFLIAGFTPFFSLLFGVQVANGAHLGGALGGALMAILANGKHLYRRLS